MHARDTTTEKELDTVLQMTVEQVLIQRFKQSPKCTTKVAKIHVNATKPGNSFWLMFYLKVLLAMKH